MTIARLVDVKLHPESITLTLQHPDRTRQEITLPMADFILLRLRLGQLASPPIDGSAQHSHQQLQVIRRTQLTVLKEALSGDPVLKFRLTQLGDLAVQIPKEGLPGMMQTLLPYRSQGAATQKVN